MRNEGTIDDFLRHLGEPTDTVPVTLDDLARRVPRSLKVVLQVTRDVPDAVLEIPLEAIRFETAIKEATPIRVVHARHYEGGTDALTLVDSEWALLVDLYWQRRDTDDPTLWSAVEDIGMTGTMAGFLSGGYAGGDAGVGNCLFGPERRVGIFDEHRVLRLGFGGRREFSKRLPASKCPRVSATHRAAFRLRPPARTVATACAAQLQRGRRHGAVLGDARSL